MLTVTRSLVRRFPSYARHAILIAAAATTACAGQPSPASPPSADHAVSGTTNQLSSDERRAGWQLLFDGISLTGWRGLGFPGVPAGHWTVEDGAIRKIPSGRVAVQADGQPTEGGDLLTVGTYRDFELAWDWKISSAGNSGVKYNVSEELSTELPPRHAAKGFEYQMLDDDRHADGKLGIHRTSALYDLIAPPADRPINAVGQWNHSVIILNGDHGEHWLNGRKVVEYDLGSPAMKLALAGSKYAPIPWFAVRRAGHIVLQDHGDEAFWRNVKIRELRR